MPRRPIPFHKLQGFDRRDGAQFVTGVSRILCKLKNAVQIEQIYSKGAARKSAVPFAVILAVNLPYVKDQ